MTSAVSPACPASATRRPAISAGTGTVDRSDSRTTSEDAVRLSGSDTVQACATIGAMSARSMIAHPTVFMPYLTSRLTTCSISSDMVMVLEFSS